MNVEVAVWDYEFSGDDQRPDGLADMIEWLKSKMQSIPPEFQGSAEVRISSKTEYDCDYLEMSIVYLRPESATEESARVTQELAARAQRDFDGIKRAALFLHEHGYKVEKA